MEETSQRIIVLSKIQKILQFSKLPEQIFNQTISQSMFQNKALMIFLLLIEFTIDLLVRKRGYEEFGLLKSKIFRIRRKKYLGCSFYFFSQKEIIDSPCTYRNRYQQPKLERLRLTFLEVRDFIKLKKEYYNWVSNIYFMSASMRRVGFCGDHAASTPSWARSSLRASNTFDLWKNDIL